MLLSATAGTAGQEAGEPVSQCHRQFVHVQQCDVTLAALDTANVCAVKPGFGGKVFLRPATEFARAAHTVAELAKNRLL